MQEESNPTNLQSLPSNESGPEANQPSYNITDDDIGRLRLAFEVPAGKPFGDFAKSLKVKIAKISIMSASKGLSARGISSVIIEVATMNQLSQLKRLAPDFKEVKNQPKGTPDATVVLVNKLEHLPEKSSCSSAIEEFGTISKMLPIHPFNILVEFASIESAQACLKAGGVYIDGRRFLCRRYGQKAPLKELPHAWLHGLPHWAKDFHLDTTLAGAHDWMVIRSPGQKANQFSVFSKVWFPSQEAMNLAVNSTTILDGRRLHWSVKQVCSICGDDNHLSMCPTRSTKMLKFGRQTLSPSMLKLLPTLPTFPPGT